jgi:predicted negative regulator of RcsB-dependent stress response
MEFIARRWWRRAEVWAIAIVLVAGGSVLGYQACYWSLAEKQAKQVEDIRSAYATAMSERDQRLDELTRKTGSAAEKATKAATTATQAVDKALEAVDRVSQ